MGEQKNRALNAFKSAQKKFAFKDVEFHGAIELPEVTIISCKGNIGSLIGKNGIIVSQISKELNSKVRIVEHTTSEKKIIEDIIGNARLLGVNEIFAPEGKSLKIFINTNDKDKLPTTPKNLEKAIEELTSVKAKIEFQ